MNKMKNIKFLMLAVFASLILTASMQAATYIVDRTDDLTVSFCTAAAADCTLRGAIQAANANPGADVIEFDAMVFSTPQTITLTQGQLTIANNGSLTINGTGENQLTISGNNASLVFFINGGATAEINALTISDGNNGFLGGGVDNRGTLTLNTTTVSNNTSNFAGGGISNFGGNLTLNNSTVSGNTTRFSGGGIYNRSSSFTLNNSTVSDNSSQFGGGIRVEAGSTATLTNSTISRNTATTTAGGGISVVDNGTTATLNSTTFSDNSTTDPNGGGGIYVGFGSTANLNNTISANSTSGGDCVNAGSTINAEYSLIEDGLDCVNGTNNNNLTGDPMLGPLQDNGGSTFTHALLQGSIAIDAGNSTLTTDQRGFMRPVDLSSYPNAEGGNGSDIGSFEYQGLTPTDKDQCKKGGFMNFDNPTFKNQGQCVSYVNGRRP